MIPVGWSKVNSLLLCVDQTVMWEGSWTGQILTHTHSHSTHCQLRIHMYQGNERMNTLTRMCVSVSRKHLTNRKSNLDRVEAYWHETSCLFLFPFFPLSLFCVFVSLTRGQDHLRVWRRPLVTEELTPQEKRLTKRSAGSRMCHLITEEGQERNRTRKEE